MRAGGSRLRQHRAPVLPAGWRRALPMLAFGILTCPASVLAQNAEVTLPEVKIIATTPLSSVRPARQVSSGGGGSPRPATTTAPAARTAAPTPGPVAPSVAPPANPNI